VPRESFDAFGQRRDMSTWHGAMNATDLANARKVTHHGFTHHEHLDNLAGLVHAGGRVLDSVTGRFLSVDPMFQAPTNSQSVNPYSYVMNNPLSLVDPSGYAACAGTATTDANSTTTTTTCATTATDIDSHIDHHGNTTVTTTKDVNGHTTT
jgi:RHS repeat-associated protein